jgi:hypothetical protein
MDEGEIWPFATRSQNAPPITASKVKFFFMRYGIVEINDYKYYSQAKCEKSAHLPIRPDID